MSYSNQKTNWLYRFFYRCMCAAFWTAYSRREYVGREQLPTDGVIVFGPNHSNALMDALALLVVYQPPIVFVARADIFRQRWHRFFLKFFKIMPIMRKRDGRENLSKNAAIMHQSVEVLHAGIPFCIMPEGTHRMQHGQLPLVKGIFRIALQACELIKDKPVYIVPFGIEYGSYVRYRSSLLTEMGEPINVSEYVAAHADMEPSEQMVQLRRMLTERLSKVHLTIPDDGYEPLYECCQIAGEPLRERASLPATLLERRCANQRIADTLYRLWQDGNAAVDVLLQRAAKFAVERKRLHVSANSFNVGNRFQTFILRVLFLVCALPYAAFAAVAALPVWGTSELVCAMFLHDKAFYNSFRFVLTLFIQPLAVVALAIVGFVNWSWWIALFVVLLQVPTPIFVHIYAKQARLAWSDWQLLRHTSLLQRLDTLRADILRYCA